MTTIGILCGLAASIFMAIAYACSGRALRLCPDLSSLGLLARAHIIMGLFSAVGLCFFWLPSLNSSFPDWSPIVLYGVLFYLFGQGSLFMAQKKVEPSRIVPLLGLKLIVLALLNVLFLKQEVYGIMQIIAIVLTILSAFMLNNAGKKIPLSSMFWVLAACCGYATSDIFIKMQVDKIAAISDKGLTYNSLLSSSLSYALCGIAGLILIPFLKRQGSKVWRLSFPFALFWLLGIVFLFACFDQIGPVNGNIVQSSRAIWAVLLGLILSKTGHTYLEEKVSKAIFLRRLAATIILVLAIVLYNL